MAEISILKKIKHQAQPSHRKSINGCVLQTVQKINVGGSHRCRAVNV